MSQTNVIAVQRSRADVIDRELVELVDAIAQAVDVNRTFEVDRVRSALEPFGGVVLFDAEIRLSGLSSADEWCICGGEVS